MVFAALPTQRTDLPLIESALLWTIRASVIGRDSPEIAARMSVLFKNLKAPEAGPHACNFMAHLRLGARRRLNIFCVCQPNLSADELLLLDVLALQQEAHEEDARMLLEQLALGNAAEFACAHAVGLTLALNTAGHFLPRGADAARRYAFSHRGSTGNPQNFSLTNIRRPIPQCR